MIGDERQHPAREGEKLMEFLDLLSIAIHVIRILVRSDG
jgi:hypothetical protein